MKRHLKKDSPDFTEDWSNERLAHLVRGVAKVQARALQNSLNEYGVSFAHWSVLRVLWATQGLTQKQISKLTGVTEPTTAAAIKSMQTLGYITRQQEAGNQKNWHIYLSPQGKRLEEQLVPLAEQVNFQSLQGMSTREVLALRKGLIQILRNLEDNQ